MFRLLIIIEGGVGKKYSDHKNSNDDNAETYTIRHVWRRAVDDVNLSSMRDVVNRIGAQVSTNTMKNQYYLVTISRSKTVTFHSFSFNKCTLSSVSCTSCVYGVYLKIYIGIQLCWNIEILQDFRFWNFLCLLHLNKYQFSCTITDLTTSFVSVYF